MATKSVLPFLVLTSCLQIGTGSNADPASTSTPATTAAATGANDAGPLGTGCAVDAVSGVTLCTSITACPNVVIDHDVYPYCGFRVPSNSIDIECVCDEFLCPVGTALTCAQAAALLASQSALTTCTAENEGRCAPRSVTPPSNGSTCDKSCAADCAGEPGCLNLCGC